MTRLVEISAESVAGVRSDVVATRDAVHGLGSLRSRAWALGVDVSGFDRARWVADRLDTSVLPVVDVHLARARDLEDLRYGGPVGCAIPVVEAAPDPFTVPPSMFTQAPGGAGTVLSWEPASLEEQAADAAATAGAQSLGDWFSGHWDDVAGAVDEGVDRLAAGAVEAWDEGVDRLAEGAVEAWNAVTERGAEIGGWWETWTADRGAWVDEKLAGVREFIGTHIAGFRVAASVCRVLGWVVVAAGAVLTVGLAVIGAMGGAAIGAVFGFGVGAVPAGGAGAAAGAAYGLKILGAGFSIVSVGDFLDVAADWGEGTIDGQELVQKGSLELALAVGSFVGAGALGKILQKAVMRLPASWRTRLSGLLDGAVPHADDPPRTFLGSMRRYLLADGTFHDAAFGPGQAAARNAQDTISEALDDPDLFAAHGEPPWSRAQLVDVVMTPVADLTPTQSLILREIADRLPPPSAGDAVAKVLRPTDFDRLVVKGGIEMGGSVARFEDVAHLDTVAKLHDALRLDYGSESPFKVTDEAYHVLRFKAQTDAEVSRFSSLGGTGGTDGWTDPYTGNGFLKSADLIPEYRLKAETLEDGAEVWEVAADGSQRLTAVLKAGEWVRVS